MLAIPTSYERLILVIVLIWAIGQVTNTKVRVAVLNRDREYAIKCLAYLKFINEFLVITISAAIILVWWGS